MVKDLLAAILAGRKKARGHYAMRFDERRTVVGIGAPAGAFLPEAGELLGAKVIVPEHAEVANAVGAISGKVVVREALSIRPDEVGSFVLTGPMGRKEFGHLRDAEQVAREYLVSYLRTRAREFGTDEKEVTVRVADKTGLLADGSRQFLELVVEGELIGNPRGKHFGF